MQDSKWRETRLKRGHILTCEYLLPRENSQLNLIWWFCVKNGTQWILPLCFCILYNTSLLFAIKSISPLLLLFCELLWPIKCRRGVWDIQGQVLRPYCSAVREARHHEKSKLPCWRKTTWGEEPENSAFLEKLLLWWKCYTSSNVSATSHI